MAIQNTNLSGVAEVTIASTGVSTNRAVISLIFCNQNNSSVNITAYAYGNSSLSGTINNMFINQLSLPAYDTYVWSANEKFILNTGNGEKITARGSLSGSVAVVANYYDM